MCIAVEEDCAPKWTQSALTPLENLRKQLEKLDDLEEQFPNSVHADTYLRYPFSGPGTLYARYKGTSSICFRENESEDYVILTSLFNN